MAFASTKRFLCFSLALVSGSIAASEDRCKALRVPTELISESCQCRDAFPKQKITAPKGMALKAVCKPYSEDGLPRAMDLDKEAVSLDEPVSNFFGALYFAGTAVLSGVVRIQQSDAGNLWFYPTESLKPPEGALSDFSELKLFESVDGQKFGLPKDISDPRWYTCARAVAKIRIRGIWTLLSEQDYAGDYAVVEEVLSHSPFEKMSCQ